MSTILESFSQRREFVRIPVEIPVRYKFLSREIDLGNESILEGTCSSLGGGGLILCGRIPSFNWIPALLMGKIQLGVNLLLPSVDVAVKGLCHVAWIDEIPENKDRCVVGLKFLEISKEEQDLILKYLIKSQMRKS